MHKPSLTDGLIGLAFLIGLGIRLVGLGHIPLNDAEAGWAMQALHIARGANQVGAQAGTVLWSGALFSILGSSIFGARFFSAAIGSFIILVPLFFKDLLGKRASILLAFGLAMDPLLVGTARQVDGLSMALAFLGLSIGFFHRRAAIPLGVCLALYFLSGPAAWLGLLIIGITLIVWRLISGRDGFYFELSEPSIQLNWRYGLVSFAASLFVAGTLFMQVPTGLSGLFNGLAAFWKGWGRAQISVSPAMTLASLISYSLMPAILGLIGMIMSFIRRQKLDLFFSTWTLLTLAILIVFPAFQVRDMAWLVLPLWVLAVRHVDQWMEIRRSAPALLLAFILIIMGIFILINLSSLAGTGLDKNNLILRWVAIGIGILIILLTAFLVSWGWSNVDAISGLRMGGSLVLIVLTLTGMFRAAGFNGKPNFELISQSPAFVDQDLVKLTIGDFSEWKTGQRDALDVVSVGINSSALDWTLRNFYHYQSVSSLAIDQNPSVILLPVNQDLQQKDLYTGQEFTLKEVPQWNALSSQGWLSWIMRREVPVEKDTAILWVRSDLFPGASKITP